MKRLRDKDFQDLLENYPRARPWFYRANEVTDEVSSALMLRDSEGGSYMAEDYLVQFERYVREHKDEITAVGILLDRPAEWSPAALTELHQKLAGHKLRFSVDRLQRATELSRKRALVDIISLVKHAADADQPLLTASERVDRALGRITAGRAFTSAQRQWLDHIRAHLVANLSISKEDFSEIPTLEHLGGWSAAVAAFGGDVTPLLREINEGLAA